MSCSLHRLDSLEPSRDRRSFIRNVAAGTAGLCLGRTDMAFPATGVTSRSQVSFVTGSDRRDMVYQALKPFEQGVREAIRGKRVLVKPNLVGKEELSATHADAVRGVLDFLVPIHGDRVIVGDSTGRTYPGPAGTAEHYRVHGYHALEDEYRIRLADLNDMPTRPCWVMDGSFRPVRINIIDTFLDPDTYIISVTRLKTHGDVVATLTIKNIVMGSPISHYRQHKAEGRNEKALMHSGGIKGINFNIFLLARRIRPHLSVIDGLVGMEGNGPAQGTPVGHGIALAGTDPLAVDRMGLELMGIDPDDVGYLTYLSEAGPGTADIRRIDVIGPDYRPHVMQYRLHDNIDRQLTWKEGLVVDPE